MPNRRVRLSLAGASLALLALGACVPRAAPPPAPLPAPAPAPRPVPPPPPPAPVAADWQTGPASPGDWAYMPAAGTPTAVFRATPVSFAISCQQDRVIRLGVNGAEGRALVVRTSFGMRRLPAERARPDEVAATLPVGDPLLAQMAFSRGRFLVTIDGGPALVVPAWPEFARVVEDCRGQ